MAQKMITLEHYNEPDQAHNDRELLEEAGMHPVIIDDRQGDVMSGPPAVDSSKRVALQVPQSEASLAYDILEEHWESQADDMVDAYDRY